MGKFIDWDPNPNEEQGYANGGAVAGGMIITMLWVIGWVIWKYGGPIWNSFFGA